MELKKRPLTQEVAYWTGAVAALKLERSDEDPTLGFARRQLLKEQTIYLIKRDKEERNVYNVAQG